MYSILVLKSEAGMLSIVLLISKVGVCIVLVLKSKVTMFTDIGTILVIG